jgi:type III secretion protein W
MSEAFRIDGGPGPQNLGDLHGDHAASEAGAKGSLAGLAVKVATSQESLLANAAEELTFCVDNTEELDLKERKEKKAIGSELLERVKLYQELMRREGRQDKIEELAAALRGAASAKDVLEKAEALFQDPADAYAALSEMAEDDSVGPFVKEALAELMGTGGEEIKASLAGALAGEDFPDLGPPLELKSDYVRAAVDFPGPLEMLGNILKSFGPDGFDRGVDFLVKALSADLAADKPSRDKTVLESVSGQLGQVRILGGVRALGQNLAERWRSAHGQEDSKLGDMDFVKFVLEGSKDHLKASSLADLVVALANPPDIEKEVLFRQDFFNAAKNVSIQTFGDPEARGRLLSTLQEGLDLAVAKEDEWLAAQEEGE